MEDAADDPRFDGTVFDENGLVTKTMICVPLNDLHDVIGCVQVVNNRDGSLNDADELQLCERMTSLVAITIDEKGLIVDLGEKKEVLATLKDVTKEFPSGDGVLQVPGSREVVVLPEAFELGEDLRGCCMKAELLLDKTAGVDRFGKQYLASLQTVMESLETRSAERPALREAEIRAMYAERIDEGQTEVDGAAEKLSDARKQLDDGEDRAGANEVAAQQCRNAAGGR